MVTNFDNSLVLLRDWGKLNGDLSRVRFKGYEIDCDILDIQTDLVIDFPYDVTLLYGEVLGHNSVDGDKGFSFVRTKANGGTPAGVIGAIIETALQNATVIKMSKLPTEELRPLPGDYIRIGSENNNYTVLNSEEKTEGATTFEEITILEPLTEEKSIGSIVELRIYNCEAIPFLQDRTVDFGRSSFGSSYLPPTMELVIEYHHKTALTIAKKIPMVIGLYYGKLNGE